MMTLVAGVPLALAAAAFGQQQVNNGNVSDANNQIGSGGSNGAVQQQPINQAPANIQQQGYYNYLANHGLLTNSRINENIHQNINTNNSNGTVGANSGGQQTFTLPASALPPPPPAPSPTQIGLNGYVSTYINQQNDTRLQPLMANGNYNPLPAPDELDLPGPVDPSAASSYFENSWVSGMGPLDLGTQSSLITPTNLNPSPLTPNSATPGVTNPGVAAPGPTGPVEQARLSEQQVEQIRQELNNAPNQTAPGNPANPSNSNSNTANSNTGPTGSSLNGTSASGNQPIQPTNLTSTQIKPTNLAGTAGDLSTGQMSRQELTLANLPPAWQQSSQFAELRQRLDEYNKANPMSDEEANREFLAALQAYRKAMASTANPENAGQMPQRPAGNVPGGMPAGAPTPGGSAIVPGGNEPLPPAPSNATAFKPLEVTDLAAGMDSKALSDLVHEAETLVQTQQYIRAISVYDDAVRVAPNNPLMYIGRAEAELGGAFYRQAEIDLRLAFRQDNAVLMGQFDLSKQFGDDRLRYIEADLKQVAADQPDTATPVFLLAFITYNSGREEQAAEWLNLAAERTRGDDIIPLLQHYWNLQPSGPATQPTGDSATTQP
jgi:tetratricopeptide (TPR) repeat protein